MGAPTTFWESLGGTAAARERLVQEFVDAARAAWPTLEQPAERFLAHVAQVATPSSAEDLAALHGADLWLACACLNGDAQALELLEKRYLVRTEGSIAHIDPSSAFIDDVRQEVRSRLLLGPRPRLGEYQGRGALAGWLKTVSARQAISMRRRPPPTTPGEVEADFEALGGLTSSREFDVHHLGERYREAFTRAYRGCLTALSERDRALLRLHYVERQSVDRIGALYEVHRATAARWVAQARDRLKDLLLAELQREVGVPHSELSSLVAALETQLDVSLRTALSP